MGVLTIEGIVDGDRIRLKGYARLPDKARVYIVLPDVQVEQVLRVPSPRLASREQMVDFVLEVVEGAAGASV